jgi:gliding motility-associated-like protein
MGGDVCNLSYVLQATPSEGSGLWEMVTGPGNAAFSPSTSDPTATVTVDPYGSYEFSWTETNGICIDKDTVTINFYQQPLANPGIGGDICGNVFTFQAEPSVGSGFWTKITGPGDVTFSPDTIVPNAEVIVDVYGTYGFAWTEINGTCSAENIIIVSFTEQPLANAGLGGDECDLDFGLEAIPSVGSGLWRAISGPGIVSFETDATLPYPVVTVSEYGSYEFEWSETNGNCYDSDTITVNFYEQPEANAGPGGDECGMDILLRAVPSVGTGHWDIISGPGNISYSPGSGQPSVTAIADTYGNYEFKWMEVNGICSDRDTIKINFFEQPVANAGTGGTECDLDFILNAVPSVGTGSWEQISGPGTADFSLVANQDATVIVDTYGIYEFQWREVNEICSDESTVTVRFNSLPDVFAGEDISICEGETVSLSGSGDGSYHWYPAGLLNKPNTANPVASVIATTEFLLTVIDQYGCRNSDEVIVTVLSQPGAYAGTDQTLDYAFETLLEAEIINSDVVAATAGEWSLISGTGEFNNKNSPVSRVTGLSLGENKFLWSVSNLVCPTSTDEVIITVNDLIVPTWISPNEDGMNDYFLIKGIENTGRVELTIFDRWGAEVYKTNNYLNDWDGRNQNGDELPGDTYFFILSSANGNIIKGYIVVQR